MRTRSSAAPSKRLDHARSVRRLAAARGARDMRLRWTGSRPIGASTSPLARAGTPSTSARYSFSTVRPANWRDERAVRRVVLGDHEQARGAAVEAVDDAGAQHAADAGEVAHVVRAAR